MGKATSEIHPQGLILAGEHDHAMKYVSRALIALVALLHIYVAWFEIFAWTEVGPDVFSTFDPEIFAQTTDIAANQGIYNLRLSPERGNRPRSSPSQLPARHRTALSSIVRSAD